LRGNSGEGDSSFMASDKSCELKECMESKKKKDSGTGKIGRWYYSM